MYACKKMRGGRVFRGFLRAPRPCSAAPGEATAVTSTLSPTTAHGSPRRCPLTTAALRAGWREALYKCLAFTQERGLPPSWLGSCRPRPLCPPGCAPGGRPPQTHGAPEATGRRGTCAGGTQPPSGVTGRAPGPDGAQPMRDVAWRGCEQRARRPVAVTASIGFRAGFWGLDARTAGRAPH